MRLQTTKQRGRRRAAKGRKRAALSAQQSIPYTVMHPDGVCRLPGGLYTKTVEYEDINYSVASTEDQTAIFSGWSSFLNYFDSSLPFQLSFINRRSHSRGRYILAFNSPSTLLYCAAMCFVYGGIMSAGYVAGGTLVASWFPKKKGAVMGYTTMGHNFASAFYVQLLSILIGPSVLKTIGGAVIPIGIAAIVLGVLGMILIRNTPQERGLNPDNVSDKVYQEEYDTNSGDDSGWTVGKLLATKELWLAAVTTGFFQICSVGVMTQLVLRNVEIGFEQQTVLNIMTVLALGGVVGSWLVGVIDEKIGTKKTMIGFGVWYCIALLLNFATGMTITPLVYVSLFMIAMGIGGSANFTTSLPTSIFGRQGFDKVNAVIFPIQGAITALCFAVNGIVQLITGGQIRMAYIVFAGVALVNVVLVLLIDEHKYNRDWKAAHKAAK